MDAEKRGVFLGADLPEEVRRLIDGVPLRENHGCSGAQTFYFPRDGGMYLKTAPSGSLERAWRMQAYFAEHGLSSPVVLYVSGEQDWMVTAALPGEDGTSPRYLADPERLCTVFGAALRRLHETDATDCPVRTEWRSCRQWLRLPPSARRIWTASRAISGRPMPPMLRRRLRRDADAWRTIR